MENRPQLPRLSGSIGYATSQITPDSSTFEVDLNDIEVPDDATPLNSELVDLIAGSIEANGLRFGGIIDIRWAPAGHPKRAILVTGRHRLEAFRRLGWTVAVCAIFDGTAAEAELWRRCENAIRREIPPLERAEAIAALIKHGQNAQVSGGRGNTGGVSAVARALGVSRRTLGRDMAIAGLTKDAKKAAIDQGVSNSSTILQRAASEPGAEAQIAAIQRAATKIHRRAESHAAMMENLPRQNALWHEERRSKATALLADIYQEYGEQTRFVLQVANFVRQLEITHGFTIEHHRQIFADVLDAFFVDKE